MWLLLVLGLFCLLLVIGSFTKWGAIKFAVKGAVVLIAVGFVLFVGILAYEGWIEPAFNKPEPAAPSVVQPLTQRTAYPSFGSGRSDSFESDVERRSRLGLPKPFETVLSRTFPSKISQKVNPQDETDTSTIGWDMRVSELPNITPSTRKTGFVFGIEKVVITLDDSLQLVCINDQPRFQGVLSGCRPVEWIKGTPYQQFDGDWKQKTYPIGTKVEIYAELSCTRALLDAKETCDL